jgi:hypothetical protein
MVVFSSEPLAYYDLTFIILVSTGQARGIFTGDEPAKRAAA